MKTTNSERFSILAFLRIASGGLLAAEFFAQAAVASDSEPGTLTHRAYGKEGVRGDQAADDGVEAKRQWNLDPSGSAASGGRADERILAGSGTLTYYLASEDIVNRGTGGWRTE